MKAWRSALGVRARLTLWYVAAMVIVLTVYAAGVFGFVRRSVSDALDARVRSDFTWAVEMWEQRPDGTVTWFDADDVAKAADLNQDEDNPWLQVWTPEGELLFQTAVARRNPLPQSAALAAQPPEHIVSVDDRGPTFRVLSRPAHVGGKPVVIQVARSDGAMRHELQELTIFLVLGLPFGVAAAGLGGYALARGALAPVTRMAVRAQSITAARLNDRLPVDHPHDELGRLAVAFNETLERLEQSFEQMQRFTGDVSHELRTPLTAIRTVGEVALREARSPDAYRTTIGSMLEEVDRLTSLVERLLTLSRAASGPAHLQTERVDLGELADEVAGYLGVLAEENGQSIAVRRSPAAVCDVDRLVLRQALVNLVDNAIKYSPADSEIAIRTFLSDADVVLEVRDAGAGIAPERGALIFDRHYRANAGGRGAGLGLAIAKWAVEVNRGQLTWQPATGGGSVFRMTLPRATTGGAIRAAGGCRAGL
jgi:heavy metal sensor kinase